MEGFKIYSMKSICDLEQRFAGLDCLRIYTITENTLMHIFSYNALLSDPLLTPPNYYFMQFIRAVIAPFVNVFGIIGGCFI